MDEPANPAVARRNVGWVVLTASAIAVVLATWSGINSTRYAHCQAAVNEALVVAQNARADAAAQDRVLDRQESAATAGLIKAVFSSTTRDQTLAAYLAYQKTIADITAQRAETERQRAAHPLPAPPSHTC
jgi:hypothetical protein